ncbi:hypothetical protein BDV95DRAFT_667313 [Massariosphaeria phaeospora]|uniref:Uncharacterized protein n=1 Tax=Massariosphaeria phaeospora TaxID=100035 RepID=A0A7C8M999_9PLEO|nr:hypothetical protein BDV95DRAFT_667313 [Massariosphaeria phaeospora]
MSSTQPFRFLDLPKELRLMVYERIPVTTRKHGFEDPIYPRRNPDATTQFTIFYVIKSMPAGLLSTCRLIYAESHPFFMSIMSRLQREPTRYILDGRSDSSPIFVCDYIYRIKCAETGVASVGKGCKLQRLEQAIDKGSPYPRHNGPKIDLSDVPMHSWMIHCAHWNVIRPQNVFGGRERPVHVAILIQPDSTDSELDSLSNIGEGMWQYFSSYDGPDDLTVVAKDDGKPHNTKFVERLCHSSQSGREPWRANVLDERQWAREWEEGDVFLCAS